MSLLYDSCTAHEPGAVRLPGSHVQLLLGHHACIEPTTGLLYRHQSSVGALPSRIVQSRACCQRRRLLIAPHI